MHKLSYILITALLLSLLCSCENAGLSLNSPESPAEESAPAQTSSPDISGETPEPSESPSVDNEQRKIVFRTFLSDNYQTLSNIFYAGISGIGFIDLDLDGGMEMLIFDAGASAAMGADIFDIIDGKVECVSASLEAVGKAFGGDHISDVCINANHFYDFHLMEETSSGDRFFIVESGNGAEDFIYRNLIRFGNSDGVLTLESLTYKREEYDTSTGDIIGESYKVKGKPSDKADYQAAYDDFSNAAVDTGFEAEGVLVWTADYESSYDGLMAMADNALSLFNANFNS